MIDFAYPGIEIKVEFIVLDEYLSQMSSSIHSICQGYLDQEIKKHEGEDYYEYQHIFSVAEEELPRIVLLPIIVSIYALFESSMARLMAYAQKKEGKGLSIKDVNGKSPAATYNKYMKHVLGYEFQILNTDMETLSAISKIRNCVAHTNGIMAAMSDEKANELHKINMAGFSIDRISEQISLTNDFNIAALKAVQGVVQNLMSYMETRYEFKLYA